MAVNFYDVNFNQNADGSSSGLTPAISGYIIDDDGYENRITYEGKISEGNILSKASATNNIQGAIGMVRKQITVNDNTIVCCPLLQGNNIYVVYSDTVATVTIIDDDGTVIESLTLPYDSDSSNLSFIGHFNANNELDWLSVCCSHRDDATGTIMYIINTTGFSASFTNAMDDYTYLKYKYPYQVVIQKSLDGTDDFQISRFPNEWLNKKIYGTGTGQSNKYNEVVFRLDPEHPDIYDQSCAWWRDPPVSTAPQWYSQNVNQLALAMGNYAEDKGISFGSDITRLLPDGKYYNGLDLNNTNLSWTQTASGYPDTDYVIEFRGGKLKFTFEGLQRYIQLLDEDNTMLDHWQLPYPVSGGASSIATGTAGSNLGRYGGIGALYLAENNKKYCLVALYGETAYYDDDGNQIILSSVSTGTYYGGIAFRKVYEFSDEGNNILSKATKNEKIVPANPDELTAEESSNQTTDDAITNEFGENIPIPKYSEGEWDDHSTDGIRGSGNGQEIGEHSQKTLDQQPDLPDAPSIPSAVSTGFVKIYNPSNQDVLDLCNELTSDSILNVLNKYFGNNPLDFIVGLQTVPGTYTTETNYKYKITYGSYSSDVALTKITNENCEIDYGTLNLKEIYGNWQDYNPHTKMCIYLPYIGIRDVDTDRIQGTELNLKYFVNAITGSILARLTSVRVDNENMGAEILVGQWCGQASYTIPLTNTQHNSAVNAVIGLVSAGVSVGSAVATGGATIPATAGLVGGALLSGAKMGKTDVTMQGGVSGSLAFCTGHDAYIQIEYPLEGRPKEYNHIIGKPSNITTDLRHQPLNNYIEFVNVDVSGINAPNDEKQVIVNMLKGGVYT